MRLSLISDVSKIKAISARVLFGAQMAELGSLLQMSPLRLEVLTMPVAWRS